MDALNFSLPNALRAGLAGDRRAWPIRSLASRPAEPPLGRIGTLEVRLARGSAEIRAAQALRYRVFFEEMSAQANWLQRLRRLDQDRFDRHCDHMIVVDRALPGGIAERIVGTYRVMRGEKAAAAGGFYTQTEFDIAPLLATHAERRFLELGRSCVLKPYRGKRTAELLWQGIWAYVLQHRIDALFGCASLPGVDLVALAPVLAQLREAALAPPEWRAEARPERRARVADNAPALDSRRALAGLPPLVKGYLRVGAYVGDGAVVDHHFGTTDVLVVLPVERISARYIEHYGADAGRFAA